MNELTRFIAETSPGSDPPRRQIHNIKQIKVMKHIIQTIRHTARAATVLILALLAAQTAWAWQGQGTQESPYQISSTEDLDQLATNVNSGTGAAAAASGYSRYYFALTNDIEYSHKTDGEEGASTETNYTAIGCVGHPFMGHFDGNNKTISGIRIYKDGTGDADSYQGIFGWTGQYADIHDRTLGDEGR